MENLNQWTFTPEMFYPPNQPTSFIKALSHQPQKQNRIVKAVRHSSPHNPLRRGSGPILQMPTRTRSVTDRRPTFPQSRTSYPQTQNRPISWHPTSFDQVDQSFDYWDPTQVFPDAYLDMPFPSSDVNDVTTPLSLPLADEPHIQEVVTPLDEINDQGYYQNYDLIDNWPLQIAAKLPSEPSTYSYNDGFSIQYDDMYDQFTATRIETAPPSPTFVLTEPLDREEFGSALKLTPTSGTEELVGMGLYDSPAEVQSSLLFGGRPAPRGPGSFGKALKLADSFEPPVDTENDDDETEEEGHGNSSDEDDRYAKTGRALMSDEEYPQLDNLSVAPVPVNQQFYFAPENAETQFFSQLSEPNFNNLDWQTVNYPYGWI